MTVGHDFNDAARKWDEDEVLEVLDYLRPEPARSDAAPDDQAPADSAPDTGADDALVLDPASPLETARALIAARYMVDGRRAIHHRGGEFFVWNGRGYQVASEEEIRHALYNYLGQAWRATDDGLRPFNPNKLKVANVLDALRAEAHLQADTMPLWLDGQSHPEAREIIAFRNTLLHLPTGNQLPLTPAYFTLNALDFEYDPDADCPEWRRFLQTIWPNDPVAIATLQEIAGYLLTPDTRQQKIFLIVGPKRSGKGTIGSMLEALVGAGSACAPTLNSLSSNFGQAPLIGKLLALISDARLGSRADQATIAERLLSISGEDAVTIDRKYLPPWTGRLAVRFVIMSNELPRLADASGALASRFVLLVMDQSFYGREDHGLRKRLLAELPGILNWAIGGWSSLDERGYFVPPPSAQEAMSELEALGSPIGAFVHDRCIIEAGATVPTDDLFQAWQDWCKEHGREKSGTKQSFGRDLRAAVPGLKIEQKREGEKAANGNRKPIRKYEGIRVR